MKIVSMEELCALPNGTIFSNFTPNVVEGLYRRGEVIMHDGIPSDFFQLPLIAQCYNGDHPTIQDVGYERWALFDDSQFVVYEPEDVRTILENLK